jgi:aspartate racemase
VKTVGVLGGMGPQATMDFERRFHRAAQRRIPQTMGSGYPPLVVLYLRDLPMLWDDRAQRPVLPFQVDPRLLEGVARLGPLVDFLVIPSNAPHLFAREIEKASGRRLLSMIQLALDEVQRRGWRRVGVMGLALPTVYTEPLTASGLACEVLEPQLRDTVDRGIRAVMEGRDDETHRAGAAEALASLRARGVQGTILGCSEIPLLLGERNESPDLLNPLELLAEAAVLAALDERAR